MNKSLRDVKEVLVNTANEVSLNECLNQIPFGNCQTCMSESWLVRNADGIYDIICGCFNNPNSDGSEPQKHGKTALYLVK